MRFSAATRILSVVCAISFFKTTLPAAPDLQGLPPSLNATTSLGGNAQVPLTISNSGDSALNYSFPGVDYVALNSDQPGGPVFAWTDISGTGTLITGLADETSAGPINVGFNFPFYGQTFSSFRLSSNAFLSFSAAIPSASYNNTQLPNSVSPGVPNMLAFFWDDLDVAASGAAHYQLTDPNTFVLQFKDVGFWSAAPNKVSCQAILKSDGRIFLQYLKADRASGCTIGMQNAAMDRGLQIAFNNDFVHANLAVAIDQHHGAPWLVIPFAQRSGSVAAAGSTQVNIPLNAASLAPGNYTANLPIHSNDPDAPVLQIPVNLTVQLFFSQWKFNYFSAAELNDPAISGELADPDGDGLSNLLECALQSDPRIAHRGDLPAPATMENAGQKFLTITFPRPKTAPEFTWTPEVSSDLANWFSGPQYTTMIAATDRGDGSEVITVRDLTPFSAAGKRFMRLRVTGQLSGTVPSTNGVIPPRPPAQLTATATSGTVVSLAWRDFSSNETGFRIERKLSGGTYATVGSVTANSTTFSNSNLAGNTTYVYRICATNAGGSSMFSNEASVTTPQSVPSAPYAWDPVAVSSSQINLSWYDFSNNEASFRIERRRADTATFTFLAETAANITSYQDTGLEPSTQYFYRFAAVNGAGQSGYSSVVSATTQGPPPNPPSGFTANAISSYQIALGWTDNSTNETSFRVERKIGVGGTYKVVATLASNTVALEDAILNGGTNYYYRLTAINGGGVSTAIETNAITPAAPATPATAWKVHHALGASFAEESIALVPVWQPDGTVKIRDTNTNAVPAGYTKMYIINEALFVGELENYGAFPPYTCVTITKLIAQGTQLWQFVMDENDYVLPRLGGAAEIYTGRAP